VDRTADIPGSAGVQNAHRKNSTRLPGESRKPIVHEGKVCSSVPRFMPQTVLGLWRGNVPSTIKGWDLCWYEMPGRNPILAV